MKLPPGYVPGVGAPNPSALGGYGERMLKQLGWSRGDGLGASKQGITTALRVHKKDDTIGVGGRQRNRDHGKDWWEQAYNSAALNIQEDEASSSASSEASDEETFSPGSEPRNRDGTVASASAAELKLAARLAKDGWGRFGGRAGKLERIRRQEAAASEPKGLQPVKAAMSQGKSDSSTEPIKRRKRKIEALVVEKPAKKGKPGNAGLAEAASPQPEQILEAKPISKKEWWGASTFVSSGCLPGLDEEDEASEGAEKPRERRRAFTEDDQAELYTSSHAKKAAGRQGLGVGKGRAVGHEWKGKRKVFAEEEELQTPSVSAGENVLSSGTGRPKASLLRKLSQQILNEEASGRMKLSRLAKVVAAKIPELQQPSNFRMVLASKLAKSPAFTEEGKYVRLTRA